MVRTCSMLWHVPANAKGRRSVANPGSTPVMNSVELPSRAASSTRSMYMSGITFHGYCNTPSPDPTTSMPAARMRMTSAIASGSRVSPIAQYTMQSGLAAMIASRSLVAATPVVTSSPASSPASLPTLASDDTQTPVRSKRASFTSCFSARPPQLPVPMSATRIAILFSLPTKLEQVLLVARTTVA